MTLATLVAALQPVAVAGDLERTVTRVVHDSRQAGPDAVFVAIRGAQVDGRRFASTVDAAAIIADGPVQARPGVPVIQVADARVALALAASLLAGSPSQRLPVVGITGTNGKTTVSWLVEAICVAADLQIGVVGTTGNRIAGRRLPSVFTTPEAPVLQQLLAEMLAQGCAACAMEVSSIGLAQRRVDGTCFTTAVFTSFSQDHLDFHGTMARYLDAKLRLFRELLAPDGTAVVHGLDPMAERVVIAAGRRRIWRYGRGSHFDIRATQVELRLDGARAQVHTPAGEGTLRIRLPGAHNVDNALAAIGVALSLGVTLPVALDGLAALSGVPGRLEQVPDPLGTRTVLVDYAHSPDALARTLDSLRGLGPRRLLLVFGCGGDRDRGKRPQMGQVAAQGADRVWITNDNPRGEDPLAIIAQVLDGLPADRSRVQVEPDRAAAIHAAVAALAPGDVLLIAGKGHETTQTIGDRVLPLDDRQIAAVALGDQQAGEGT
ncbi:MAG: UDP-N-acetylmuramoyl-L-alanyl-D-glutamate--2,6-diaminopimelate ligase [Oligoflexia bacterium]|nr:UDP-N-acetylmuramoyl-L-alanyl-D-glutamate--2,6-diaminopimelate ligase [Oligoflexia bacterium]